MRLSSSLFSSQHNVWLLYFLPISLLVFFADTFPVSVDSYALQRFFLCAALAVIVIVGVLVLNPAWLFVSIKNTFLVACTLLLIFGAGLLGAGQSDYAWVEGAFFALFISGIFLGAFLLNHLSAVLPATYGFIFAVVVVCSAYSLFSLTVFLLTVIEPTVRVESVFPVGFFNVRFWSHTATWLLPFFPLVVLVTKKKHWVLKVVAVFSGVIWVWMLLETSSRGALVALVGGAMLGLFVFGKYAKPWFLMITAFSLLGFLFWMLMGFLSAFLADAPITVEGIRTSSSGRTELWAEALAMSMQNFPFGMGAQSWITHASITEEMDQGLRFGSPHNMYLLWAAEYGWLSVLLVAVLVLSGFRALFNIRKEFNEVPCKTRIAIVALFVAASAGLIHSAVSGIFMIPASALLGFIVLSLLTAVILKYGGASNIVRMTSCSKTKSQTKCRAILVLSIAIGMFTWLAGVKYYHADMLLDRPYYEENITLRAMPRFWLHGYFPRESNLMPSP